MKGPTGVLVWVWVCVCVCFVLFLFEIQRLQRIVTRLFTFTNTLSLNLKYFTISQIVFIPQSVLCFLVPKVVMYNTYSDRFINVNKLCEARDLRDRTN